MNIRDYYELKRELNAIGKDISTNLKREMRSKFARQTDRLAKSMQEEWRTLYSADGESWIEYVIFEDCGESDDEIREYVASLERYNYGLYDCTGKPFTRWIHWRRVLAGIVIIHALALDV